MALDAGFDPRADVFNRPYATEADWSGAYAIAERLAKREAKKARKAKTA